MPFIARGSRRMVPPRRWLTLVFLAGAGACLLAPPRAGAQALINEPVRPLPLKAVSDPARIALGQRLFNDKRLSRDANMSCATCHQLARGGVDGRAIAPGPDGKPGLYNTLTVYNSSFNYRQTWTGRHSGIEQLLDHFVVQPKIFPSTWDMISARLAGDPAIAAEFHEVYGDGVRPAYLKDALDQYLRSLVTPSRFDRYLRGDANAISADEETGYVRFKSYGCVACHQGINLGGNLFQKLGAMREMPGLGKGDYGRAQVTGRVGDRYSFRVPGLRNVALTAPYFHNGSVATLEEAVDIMFKYQLGRSASAQDKELIVRFLHTLSGEQLTTGKAAEAPK